MKTNYPSIPELEKRLLPITEFRRNAGEILRRLPDMGEIILMKSGIPIATLSDFHSYSYAGDVKYPERAALIRKTAGGFVAKRSLSMGEINRLMEKKDGRLIRRRTLTVK